jgi:hypothetical protein
VRTLPVGDHAVLVLDLTMAGEPVDRPSAGGS